MNQCVIALGFFDGVHLGHGTLLRRTRSLAEQYGVPAAALTFDTHPDTLIHGVRQPLINTLEEREYLMKSRYGMDQVVVLPFDRNRMCQHWETFITETLRDTYGAVHTVCGHDYRFGAKGEGNPEKLRSFGEALGIGCDCIGEVRLEGKTVSSTLIRSLIRDGRMEEAVRFLGHGHLLSGTVVSGKQLGRTLGIPTANLAVSPEIQLPRRGVYGARAFFDGKSHLAVVNIGTRPTVQGKGLTVEPWILDFDGDLYGHRVTLELHTFLRPEQTFPSLEALTAEIHRNAQSVREFFLL